MINFIVYLIIIYIKNYKTKLDTGTNMRYKYKNTISKWFFLLLFSSLFFSLQADTTPAIVSTKWLSERIDKPNIVVVDLREESAYKTGHIEGAVSMPVMKTLFVGEHMMPGLNELKELFSNAGIDNKSQVVVYDDGTFMWAARLYWVLEVMGHKEVGLLEVGYGGWKNSDLPVSTAVVIPKRKEFVPRVDNSKLETKLSTLMGIGKKTIIDGRKNPHYTGEKSLAKRFGHIPTAQNYACTQNYEVSASGNKMRDLKELELLYKDIPKDKEIILYCDGGAEAALNYIVLQELGYKAAVYDGSWFEWGNDDDVPVSVSIEKK